MRDLCFRLAFFGGGLFPQIVFARKQMHKRADEGAQSSFGLIRRPSVDSKPLQQRLLRVDDASRSGDLGGK